jgi:Flp pilus assembly protein TadG
MMIASSVVPSHPRRKLVARHREARTGSAVVELAVLLPLLIFLFVVAVDFCRIFYYSQTLQNCAYSGALYASSTVGRSKSVTAESAAKTAAVAEGTTLNPVLKDTDVSYTSADTNGDVVVTVNYTFKTIFNFPGIPTAVALSRSAKMRTSPVASP